MAQAKNVAVNKEGVVFGVNGAIADCLGQNQAAMAPLAENNNKKPIS